MTDTNSNTMSNTNDELKSLEQQKMKIKNRISYIRQLSTGVRAKYKKSSYSRHMKKQINNRLRILRELPLDSKYNEHNTVNQMIARWEAKLQKYGTENDTDLSSDDTSTHYEPKFSSPCQYIS